MRGAPAARGCGGRRSVDGRGSRGRIRRGRFSANVAGVAGGGCAA
jgi:hypothetical protein